jgi:hypothetical protein
MTALQQYKAKQSALSKMQMHRATVQKALHVAEAGVGAIAAGYVDTKMPQTMGAPTSLLGGVVLTVAGVSLAMPHLSSVGVGMVIPHLYRVGQDFASPNA